MKPRRIFKYDAFISHRSGDDAGVLVSEMIKLKCNVWWDGDEPLEAPRVNRILYPSFVESRTIVAFLSESFAESPWTLLEVRSALASEIHGAHRVFFFVPDSVKIAEISLPDYVVEALRNRKQYRQEEIELLARELQQLNSTLIPRFSRSQDREAPFPHGDRVVTRLARAIRDFESSETLNSLEMKSAEIEYIATETSNLLENLTRSVDWIHEFDSTLFLLRNLSMAGWKDYCRNSQFSNLMTAVAAVHADSPNADNRANALMLLQAIAEGSSDRRASRLLRRRLLREPDCSLVNLFSSSKSREASWWPSRLYGLEIETLERHALGYRPSLNAIGHLHPAIRIALRETQSDLPIDELPIALRVNDCLSWFRRISEELRCAETRSLDAPDGGAPAPDRSDKHLISIVHSLGEIEKHSHIEITFCEITACMAEQLENSADPVEIENICDLVSHGISSLVDLSERFNGSPLRSFRTNFVDFMLPLLGVLICHGRNSDKMRRLAHRTIEVLRPFVGDSEVSAYLLFAEDCVTWAKSRNVYCARDAPVVSEYKYLRIRSKQFDDAILDTIERSKSRSKPIHSADS